jgi:hypothetical protein
MHMAAITAAANTQELQALNAEALKGGGRMSHRLMKLGVGGGSGSGVVSNYPPAAPSSTASIHQSASSRFPALALYVAGAGLFALTAVLLLLYFRKPEPQQHAIIDARPTANAEPRVNPQLRAPEPFPTNNVVPMPPAPTTTPTVATLPTEVISSSPVPPRRPDRVRPPIRAPQPAPTAAAPPAPAPAPATNDEPGKLSINVNPAARVFVDGKEVGISPLQRSLPPGPHSVTLVSISDPTVKKTVSVNIESGQTTPRSYSLP